jgi:hypothetical protein
MYVEDYFYSEQPGYDGTEDQEVRHVVYMNNPVRPLEKQESGADETPEEKF